MSLWRVLNRRRRAVLDAWLGRVAAGYPAGRQRYLVPAGDRFANPAASTLADALGLLLDALRHGAGDEELGIILDAPVRLRAVQRLRPSEAVGFVLELKEVVRSVLAEEIRAGDLEAQLTDLDRRIDAALLVAFDAYVNCREQVFKLRAVETRNAAQRLLERAGLALPEALGDPPGPPPAAKGEHAQGVTG